MLAVIILFLSLALYRAKKEFLGDYEKELILFVIDMYLSYGESLEIFPDDKAKEILINRINMLKTKIEDEKNRRKITNKK